MEEDIKYYLLRGKVFKIIGRKLNYEDVIVTCLTGRGIAVR